MQVSVGKSEVRHELPMELAGWLLKKLGVPDNSWLMVMSNDARALLASNLIVRWSSSVNVVMGNTDLSSTKVCTCVGSRDVCGCFLEILIGQ